MIAAEAFDGAAAALEGCSFSGQVSQDVNDAAVRVFGTSSARVQNGTFSGNGVDVHASSGGVLFTDTPPSALTLTEFTDVELIQPLADAPAGEFPTMASPAFVALREVRPGRPPAAPLPLLWQTRRECVHGATMCLFVFFVVYAICRPHFEFATTSVTLPRPLLLCTPVALSKQRRLATARDTPTGAGRGRRRRSCWHRRGGSAAAAGAAASSAALGT